MDYTQVNTAVGITIFRSEREAIAGESDSALHRNSNMFFAINAPNIEKKMNSPPQICS